MKHKSEKRTLLLSVLMSAPGPLILAFALLEGQSSTQIADFVRRSAELLALVMAYITYRLTEKKENPLQKARFEQRSNLFTGSMMCLGGAIMLVLAFLSEHEAKGNVIPSLVIALLGMIANSLFWRKYTKLNRKNPNTMIAVQGRLYRAKALVDTCVVIALLSVVLFPASELSYYCDKIGSSVVALYLFGCGVKTIKESMGAVTGNTIEK